MVCSGRRENGREYMASGTERLNPLHNFTLPYLKWGSQRHLRCIKDESASGSSGGGDHRAPTRSPAFKLDESSPEISARCGESSQKDCNRTRRIGAAPKRKVAEGGEEGINEFREKIMLDLRNVADKMKQSILRKGVSEDREDVGTGRCERAKEKFKEKDETPAATEGLRPWNLRTRRSSGKAAQIGGAGINNGTSFKDKSNKGSKINEKIVDSSVPGSNEFTLPTSGTRPKFSVQLTKGEIEEDFMMLFGHRPPRRPRKRPKVVQREMDFLFPGLGLTEVTADMYEVPESTVNGKK